MASISLVSPALATVNINWTSIDNPVNTPDTAVMRVDGTTGYGAVSYAYNIGTYDVTAAQYVEFLNAKGASNSAGIYKSIMGTGVYPQGSNIIQSGSSGSYSYSVSSTYANMPVVGVTWFDAARFCNWLSNGQGSGSMETGAYTLSGATSGIIMANAGDQIRLPTEDEWYKAAYYNGASGTYSRFPDGRNDVGSADAAYNPYASGLVNVNYGTPSSYGVYGMGGNVYQWNDAVITDTTRGLRGGCWNLDYTVMQSNLRAHSVPSQNGAYVGFRVASLVPEPTSVILTIFSGGMLLFRRRR